jgi:hypothetical protein
MDNSPQSDPQDSGADQIEASAYDFDRLAAIFAG